MTPHPKRSLTYRLIEAVNAVTELEKKGTNDSGQYNYLRASDVARAFRKELKKRHILITSDEKEVSGRTMQTGGGPMSMITVKVDFYFHCGLTGDVIGPRCGIGQAMDKGDKGLYKAKTGALKSFLRLFSLLPDKDDPEADETVDQATKPPKPETRKPAERKGYEPHPNQPIDLHQAKAFEDALQLTGKSEADATDYLWSVLRVEHVRALKRGQFQQALAWALTSVTEPKKENGKAQPIVEILDRVADDEVAI